MTVENDKLIEDVIIPPQDDADEAARQAAEAERRARKKRRLKKISIAINSCLVVIIVLLLGVIIFMNTFILCPVRQDSMYPTILNEQRVLLLKTQKVSRGDIFVFESDEKDEFGKNKNLIKRVIALGGDKLLFVTRKAAEPTNDAEVIMLYRDSGNGFELLDEGGYIFEPMDYKRSNLPISSYYKIYRAEEDETLDLSALGEYMVEVPSGHYYAMGDNRNQSKDSRTIGFIAKNTIIGRLSVKLRQGSFSESVLKLLYKDKSKKDTATEASQEGL